MSVEEQTDYSDLELDEETLEDLDAESDDIQGGGNSNLVTGNCA